MNSVHQNQKRLPFPNPRQNNEYLHRIIVNFYYIWNGLTKLGFKWTELKKFIKEGGKLGRNKGTTETPQQFLAKHRDVVKHLKSGQSIRNAMTLTAKSSGTVQKVKRLVLV